MNKYPRVAVIGAGLAGLSCAVPLRSAGWQVSVFDKSRGPGGRMSTRSGKGWQCDHGAQYFTACDPLFRAEVQRWQAAGVAARWQPRLAVLSGTNGHALDAALERFVGVPRMRAPACFLADSMALSLQSTVHKLAPAAGGWRVSTAEQGDIDEIFEAIILAVPAPQAVPLLRDLAPELAQVARSAVMRGSWALMARYEQRVDLPFDAAFINAGPLRWIARDNSKPGRDAQETWLLHASAEWSEAHIEDSPNAVAKVLLAAFAQISTSPPDAWSIHRWRHADSAPALTQGYAWDDARRLGLCGDWLNGGKVEGAWLSGSAMATRLIADLSSD